MRGSHKAFVLSIAALVLSAAFASPAQRPPKPNLPANPAELVRQAVAHENQPESDKTHYMYRLTKRKPDRTETREMVETEQGVIGRLLLVNGQPLSSEDREKEDKRLQR